MHSFHVPTAGQLVARQKRKREERVDGDSKSSASSAAVAIDSSALPYRDHRRKDNALDSQAHFRVFGMTARIIVDAARYAYDTEPEFEHNPRFGDESFIEELLEMGNLGPVRKSNKNTIDRDHAAAAKI